MSEEEKLKQVTNELLKDKFIQELGQKAQVEHHTVTGEAKAYTNQLREVLAEMAQDLQSVNIVSPGLEYLGSFSVHVYASELLRQFQWISINNPHKTTHPVADATMKKLKRDVDEYFTGKRQKERSGF